MAGEPYLVGGLKEIDAPAAFDPKLAGVQYEIDAPIVLDPKLAGVLFELFENPVPTQVADFAASDGLPGKVTMTFTNPADLDLAEIVVRRKVGSYPTGNSDGTLVYQNLAPVPGAPVSADDLTASPGVTYFYAVFPRDTGLSWNDLVTVGANADTGSAASVAPAQVTDFTASDTEIGKVIMGWTNPADALLSEVIVRRKVGSYPADHTDGTQVYQNLAPTPSAPVTADDLTAVIGQLYYYAVFGSCGGAWQETVTAGLNADTGTACAVTPSTTPSGAGSPVCAKTDKMPTRGYVLPCVLAPDTWSAVYDMGNEISRMIILAQNADLDVRFTFADGTVSGTLVVHKGGFSQLNMRCTGFQVQNHVAGDVCTFEAIGLYRA